MIFNSEEYYKLLKQLEKQNDEDKEREEERRNNNLKYLDELSREYYNLNRELYNSSKTIFHYQICVWLLAAALTLTLVLTILNAYHCTLKNNFSFYKNFFEKEESK